ncbi:MAG: UDP-N-acetylmuramate dehydrogenase [Candidatus Doudnabacteria bacterium]|nr:UDP-N-acetylmuramate dehydrogenase [Candidatus Doudnabacteria bacterium]
MDFKPNQPLSELTTFRIGGPASFFIEITSEEELKSALEFAKSKNLAVQIIGGGSNLITTDRGFMGLVIKVGIKAKEIVRETDVTAYLRIGSGEVWDEVVALTVSKNLWGAENLSAIPGLTGAIPVQNVGAYGQEASQIVDAVEVLDLRTSENKTISSSECGFGYRQSNFNTIWKNNYVIMYVTFKLSKKPSPNLNYVDVKKYFEANPTPSQLEIRNAITEIRKGKFPDTKELGSAGSCFKNLILDDETYHKLEDNIGKNFDASVVERLRQTKDKLKGKVPAAFLIDICGLKGRSVGGARLWEKQPLVIVNAGNASSSDIVELINQVKNEVLAKTGMELQTEPELIGF